MASSNFDSETAILTAGFDKYPAEDSEDTNRGLTEGFTELIALLGAEINYEYISGYYFEVAFVSQLIYILGLEVFLDSYFGHKGIKDIKQKLSQLDDDENKAFTLFRSIELNYRLRDVEEEQNILGSIQMILLSYFEKKCRKEINSPNFDRTKFEEMFNNYERTLITPEKIELNGKNKENYELISESVAMFNAIKEEYLNLLNSSNKPEQSSPKNY